MLTPCWKKYLQTGYNWGGGRDTRNSPTQENDTSPIRKMPDSNGNMYQVKEAIHSVALGSPSTPKISCPFYVIIYILFHTNDWNFFI